MIEPEREPGHGHRHGARDIHLHIGHTISGELKKVGHLESLTTLVHRLSLQAAAYNGLVTDLFWTSAGGDNLWQWQQ